MQCCSSYTPLHVGWYGAVTLKYSAPMLWKFYGHAMLSTTRLAKRGGCGGDVVRLAYHVGTCPAKRGRYPPRQTRSINGPKDH